MITGDVLVSRVREIVSENPNFVYERPDLPLAGEEAQGDLSTYKDCVYVTPDGSEPSCLIGQALYSLEIPLPTLQDFEGDAANILCDRLGIPLTVRQRHWLDKVQS